MCKEVEATQAEMAGLTEAEGAINHPINNTRKIRNVSIAIRRDTHPRVSQRQKRTPTTHLVHLSPVKKKAKRSSLRILRK